MTQVNLRDTVLNGLGLSVKDSTYNDLEEANSHSQKGEWGLRGLEKWRIRKLLSKGPELLLE